MLHQYSSHGRGRSFYLLLLTLAGNVCLLGAPTNMMPDHFTTSALDSTHRQKKFRLHDEQPMITLRGGDNLTKAAYIRSAWELTDQSGFLPMPVPVSDIQPIKLFVDIGLEIGSGLLCLLRSNPKLGFVLGMEAHPINFGISYVNNLNMMKYSGILGDLINKYSIVVPVGASNADGMVEFYDNVAPACGSLLKSKVGAWFCATTREVRVIPVVRLDTILSRVPPNYRFYYLKTDTEGADHLVLQGAGDYISKFEMVSIECRPANDSHGDGSREGVCDRVNITEYMKQRGFPHSSCNKFDCHFARLSEAQLYVAKTLQSIAGLPGNAPSDCSKFHAAKWDPMWDNLTALALAVNTTTQTLKQQRRQLLSGDGVDDSEKLHNRRLRRRSFDFAKAYADSLIAHAAQLRSKPRQHRRSFLSVEGIDHKAGTTESAWTPLVTDVPPIATHMTGNLSTPAQPGPGRTKINFLWKISDHGTLNIPTNRTTAFNYSLIVSVGSKLGSGLVCMLAENHNLVFLGLEPHPINFALSHHNTFRQFSYPNRATLLPMGASNRSAMLTLKQSWTVGCEGVSLFAFLVSFIYIPPSFRTAQAHISNYHLDCSLCVFV